MLYKISVRFARFESGVYTKYVPDSEVDLSSAEAKRLGANAVPVQVMPRKIVLGRTDTSKQPDTSKLDKSQPDKPVKPEPVL